MKIEKEIHDYFKRYYEGGDTEVLSKYYHYSYMNGEVMVNDISWHEISEKDYETINRLMF